MAKMTLIEAIRYHEAVAKETRKDYERACAYNISSEGFLKCAEEHEQLAEWLKELKAYREAEAEKEAQEEARREAMKLDDNEDSLKWRFTH